MWKGFGKSSDTLFNLSASMVGYLSLEDKVISIDSTWSTDVIKVAIGLANGEVYIWRLRINNPNQVTTVEPIDNKLIITHADEVTGVNFNETGTKVVSCGLDKLIYVCDVATGMILFKKEHPNSLICMKWSFIDEILYLGDNEGTIHVWDMTDGEKKCLLKAFNGPITSITCMMADDRRIIVAAGVDYSEFLVKSFKTD